MNQLKGTLLKVENGLAVISLGDGRFAYIPQEELPHDHKGEVVIELHTKKEKNDELSKARRQLLSELIN